MAKNIIRNFCIALTVLALAGFASPDNLTHMGQPSSEHVTLEVVGVNNTGDPRVDLDFIRVLPDGTRPPSPPRFRVPSGKVLVVTDVDWQYNLGDPGQVQTLRLFIDNLTDPYISSRVFESTIILNDEGKGGISENMTSGFVVSSGGRITVDSFPGGGKISHLMLRGYLIREK
jgi:hypothetical protein